MNIVLNLKDKIKKVPKYIWILFLIMAVGIFLRTYNFHDWLTFENDQVRDAFLVDNVLENNESWPLLGPTMRKSENDQGELFRLGPIYYYFQIISAKVFGNKPDKIAYPDLIFSILSIPLFYFFLKKYFTNNISLILVVLYSVSFYIIQYSRFAWNPNSIPFFVILFLISAYEILINNNARWRWFVFFGIAFGVGIQLHAVLLILFPMASIFIFWCLRKSIKIIWKKLLIVVLIFIILNLSQIISEWRNDFENTKIFINSSLIEKAKEKTGLMENIGEDLDCHIEANFYILSAMGKDECNFSFVKILKSEKSKKFIKEAKKINFWINNFLILSFSVFGYGLLVFLMYKEKNKKRKYFLMLILVYSILSFFVMFPIIDDKIAKFRYFNHVFFVPFVFLGLFAEYFINKKQRFFSIITYIIFSFLFLANINTIKNISTDLFFGKKSDLHFAIFGEMEKMVEYIIEKSDGKKEAVLCGDKFYANHFNFPFSYIAEKKDFKIISNVKCDNYFLDKPLFYISGKDKNKNGKIGIFEIDECKNIGKIIICKFKSGI